jgi:transcriptional regulator with XRE-family HTH domain
MDIGKRLDEAMRDYSIRNEIELSQSGLYRISSVPQPTINRILKNASVRGPETETLKKLASVLDVNFLWLHEGIGPKKRSASSQDDPSLVSAAEISELIALYAAGDADDRRNVMIAARLPLRKLNRANPTESKS